MKSTPYNLVMSALYGGRKGNRPPVVNPTAIVCHELMDAVGVDYPKAHLDAEAMADLALAGHEIIGFDSVMPEFSVDQEAAALGAEVDWGDRDCMPDCKNFPYENFADIVVPDDFLDQPSMRVVLDALTLLRRRVGGQAAIIGKAMGPWTLAYHMAGTQNFLLQLGMGEIEKVNTMLQQLIPVTMASITAQFQAGADIVVVADHATGNLVSAKHYKEYLLPIHKLITSTIKGPLMLHVCGNCADRLTLFADAGFDSYHFEWQTGPKYAVETVGDRICLAGCVNNPQTLFSGTADEVFKQTREIIEAGVHMIGPECCIPLSTPMDNLKAIVKAAAQGY